MNKQTQILNQRLREFNTLFDSRDLLEFYKLKEFWDVIAFQIFKATYKVCTHVSSYISKVSSSFTMKFVQGQTLK